MNAAASSAQLERFQRAITRRLALHVDALRTADLAGTLGRRVHARGMSVDGYLDWLETSGADRDVPALARELTVGETSFFRNIEQFHALREMVVPELLRGVARSRPLRVLSAGCASGEEPYSIAMTLRGMAADGPGAWSVVAVDVNPAALEKARKGVYTSWALRDTPAALQQRWFRVDGGRASIDGRIRADVAFEQRNLAGEDDDFWRPDAYDVVFCRNVLMYFTRPAAQAAVARIERSLAPDGVLFLGHAESLRGLSDGFALREGHGTFFYQRMPCAGPRASIAGASPSIAVRRGEPARAIERPTDDARVAAAPRARGAGVATMPPASTAVQADAGLGEAFALFRQERFDAAMARVDALSGASARLPEAMLLRALVLAQTGRFASAERACRQLLAIDESHAGAFYVLALCRDGLRDPAGAAREDRCAIELDPGFPMPRLHLGLLARRAGDADAARRHLGEAMALLEREGESRLGLFGGGFGREALLAICRAELRRCEGANE